MRILAAAGPRRPLIAALALALGLVSLTIGVVWAFLGASSRPRWPRRPTRAPPAAIRARAARVRASSATRCWPSRSWSRSGSRRPLRPSATCGLRAAAAPSPRPRHEVLLPRRLAASARGTIGLLARTVSLVASARELHSSSIADDRTTPAATDRRDAVRDEGRAASGRSSEHGPDLERRRPACAITGSTPVAIAATGWATCSVSWRPPRAPRPSGRGASAGARRHHDHAAHGPGGHAGRPVMAGPGFPPCAWRAPIRSTGSGTGATSPSSTTSPASRSPAASSMTTCCGSPTRSATRPSASSSRSGSCAATA